MIILPEIMFCLLITIFGRRWWSCNFGFPRPSFILGKVHIQLVSQSFQQVFFADLGLQLRGSAGCTSNIEGGWHSASDSVCQMYNHIIKITLNTQNLHINEIKINFIIIKKKSLWAFLKYGKQILQKYQINLVKILTKRVEPNI